MLGRRGNNGVSWYPGYQKIFELTDKFLIKLLPLLAIFDIFLWNWIIVTKSTILCVLLVILVRHQSSYHFEIATVSFQNCLWLSIAVNPHLKDGMTTVLTHKAFDLKRRIPEQLELYPGLPLGLICLVSFQMIYKSR